MYKQFSPTFCGYAADGEYTGALRYGDSCAQRKDVSIANVMEISVAYTSYMCWDIVAHFFLSFCLQLGGGLGLGLGLG